MEEANRHAENGAEMPVSAGKNHAFIGDAAGMICGSVYRFDVGQGDVLDVEELRRWKEPSSWKDALLLLAVQEERYRSVKWLLRVGADPNIRNIFGLPIIMIAIARQQTEVVSRLLDAGADVQVEHHGFTPWTYACMSGNEAIIRLLQAKCKH